MKILQIINSLATGGAEKLLLETLPLYREQGIEMDILLLWDNDCMFTKQLQEKGCCKIHVLKKSSRIKDIYNPLSILKIAKIIRVYNIAHVHLFPAQYWVVLAKIVSFSKIKLVFTEHNTSNRRLENPIFRFIDKFIYKFYTQIVCITPEIKIILTEHTQLPADRLQLIANGVNLIDIKDALVLKRTELSVFIQEEDKIIIQVAGFREQKDQATLIRSMALLPHHIKLLLVGDGILKKTCELLVKELQLEERVLFLGLRMDVPQLLKTADIIVLSTKYEGLSLSSIEGMASGSPFIASHVPGLAEVVQEAGILFPVGDSKQLAKEIVTLLENPKKYNEVVQKCQKRAEQYDISLMVRKHIELYKSLYEA